MKLLDYECKTTFWEDLVLRSCSEKKSSEILTRGLERNGRMTRFTERNCL